MYISNRFIVSIFTYMHFSELQIVYFGIVKDNRDYNSKVFMSSALGLDIRVSLVSSLLS